MRNMQTLDAGEDGRGDASAASSELPPSATVGVPAAAVGVREACAGKREGGGGSGGVVVVPIRTVGGMNVREHYMARSRRVKKEREATQWALLPLKRPVLPVVVTLTRVAPSSGLDSHDNLRSAVKSVADQVAQWLGLDDRDPRVTWRYEQRRGRPKEYAVEIVIGALA